MPGFSSQLNPFTSGVKECVLDGWDCPTQTHPQPPPFLLEVKSSAGLGVGKGFQHTQLSGKAISVRHSILGHRDGSASAPGWAGTGYT